MSYRAAVLAAESSGIASELDELDQLIAERASQSQMKPATTPAPSRKAPAVYTDFDLTPPKKSAPPRTQTARAPRVAPVEAPPPAPPPQPIERDVEERIDISGNYRMGFGVGRHRTFSLNDSNSDFQDRDSSYLFGERLNNTFDPEIYSKYEVDMNYKSSEHVSWTAQVNADPWSYVGVTPHRVVNNNDVDTVQYQLKYWGANNSTLPEIYRSQFRNQIAFPAAEVEDGKTRPFTVNGISDFSSTYRIPAEEIDFEFHPLRKFWTDVQGDIWHARVFALADQDQALTSDDPLRLSNNKDYWQPSPWLSQWQPLRLYSSTLARDNGAIERGHYSDTLAYNARTSYGDFLTLLRGAAVEADFGRSYVSGMIATPITPWEDYQDINNVPGAIRLKHQVTPQWMLGALYGFRVATIDREPDAYNQVLSVDTLYFIDPKTEVYGQIAGSRDEIDRLSPSTVRAPVGFKSDVEGMAYRGGVRGEVEHAGGGTSYVADAAWMDAKFRPQLSRYRPLRGDNFWSEHITFTEYSPDLEFFRLGTGLDIGRYVGRVTLRTDLADGVIDNLYDVRHVRSTDKSSFIENVMRDELTYRINPQWKTKGFARWALLSDTDTDVEPLLDEFEFINDINSDTPVLENQMIDPGLDPSTLSLGAGLQFEPTPEWTLEATYTRTNDIPDFPRGLQNNVYARFPQADTEDPNILIDKMQNFLYRQDIYDLPPYDYFSIIKEKVVYRPRTDLEFTFHAAQNSYKLWGPIDDMVNHQGISIDYAYNNKLSLFFDYSRLRLADIPHLIGSGYTDLQFRDHHNFYARLKYALRPNARLNLEYGVIGQRYGQIENAAPLNPWSVSDYSWLTIDTEHLLRLSLEGEF